MGRLCRISRFGSNAPWAIELDPCGVIDDAANLRRELLKLERGSGRKFHNRHDVHC